MNIYIYIYVYIYLFLFTRAKYFYSRFNGLINWFLYDMDLGHEKVN